MLSGKWVRRQKKQVRAPDVRLLQSFGREITVARVKVIVMDLDIMEEKIKNKVQRISNLSDNSG